MQWVLAKWGVGNEGVRPASRLALGWKRVTETANWVRGMILCFIPSGFSVPSKEYFPRRSASTEGNSVVTWHAPQQDSSSEGRAGFVGLAR